LTGEPTVRRFFLTDEQLWRAIAENTTDLSNLMDREVITGAHKNVLVQFNKLQRQYRVYTAELRRRYS
jgi:hypothetical protein